MREDFLDPLPRPRKHATLLFGTSPIDCYVVEATNVGFRVAVPNVEQYEGDPRLTIATDKGIFPVRLIRQVRHAGGYSYLLERDQFEEPVAQPIEPPVASHWWSSGPFALAVVLLIVTGWLCGPAINDGLCLLRNRGRSADARGWWGLSAKSDDSVATKVLDPSETPVHDQNIRNVHQSSDGTQSVIASASLKAALPAHDGEIRESESADRPARPQPHAKTPTNEKAAVLKTYLQAGRNGRIQVIDEKTVPWLLGAGNSHFSISIKGSAAAIADLTEFEAGLKELSTDESAEAIGKLQRALSLLISDSATPRPVAEMPDVSVISAGEASIYFRIVRGRKELVRVLPQELSRVD